MDAVASPFLLIGGFFVLAAAVGVNRLGDAFSRMQAGTKAGTLGLVSVLIANLFFFWGEGEIHVKILLTIAFLFLTSPVAAHMLTSAAYRSGQPKWERTVVDEAEALLPRPTKNGIHDAGKVRKERS